MFSAALRPKGPYTEQTFDHYLWFNPAFSPDDEKDPEVDVLRHLRSDIAPAIAFFGDKDGWKKGWDVFSERLKSLGNTTTELQVAEGQAHGFFNEEPWKTTTLIEADRFLVRLGLLDGEPAPRQAVREAIKRIGGG